MLNSKMLFASRKKWRVWQILLLGICLGMLPLFAASLRYSQLKSFSLEQLMPGSLNAVTDETVKVLKIGSVQDGRFTGESNLVQSGQSILATLPSKSNLTSIQDSDYTSIVLTEKEWLFYYPSGRRLKARLTGTQDFQAFKTVSDVKDYINSQWFLANKKSVVAFLVIKLGAGLYSSILLFLFGGGFCILHLKRRNNFDIKNLREAMGLLISSLFFPTFLLTLLIALGLIKSWLWIVLIYNLILYILILKVYVDTGFQETEDTRFVDDESDMEDRIW